MCLYAWYCTQAKVTGNTRSASQLDYALRLMRWMNHYLIEQADGIPPHELPHAERL